MIYRFLCFTLIVACAVTWAWMLGGLAPFAMDDISAKWLNPGIMTNVAILASIQGIVGLLGISGIIKPKMQT